MDERIRRMLQADPSRAFDGRIVKAQRVASREMPVATSPAARAGLRFQALVSRQLAKSADSIGGRFDPEPWFKFERRIDIGHAVPDGVFTFADFQLVIEVKQTFVLEGVSKLQRLYVPVVAKAFGLRVRPLLICKYLTSQAADFPLVETLSEAFFTPSGEVPVLHYPDSGPIQWADQLPLAKSSNSKVD